MTNLTTIHYFIYIRKSSDENARRQVLSLDGQLFELRKYAESNKISIIDVIRESKTARKPGRKEFNSMLNRIQKGMGFPVGILSWHPDRLTRNKIDETRLSTLLDAGKLADLKFPTHAFVNNASGKFFLSIQMANAKYYVDQLSENIRRGQAEKLRSGAWPGLRPFGYRYDRVRRNIVPDLRRARLVVALYREFGTAKYSIPAITVWFNALLRANRLRQRVARNGIDHLLRNQLFIGVMKWSGRTYEGRYPKILKPALFNRVQGILDDESRTVPVRTAHVFGYRGLFRCSCGAPITAQFGRGTGGVYTYYRCTRRHGPCREPYIQENNLHVQAVKALDCLRLPKHTLDGLNELIAEERGLLQTRHQFQIAEFAKKIETTERHLERLVDLHLNGSVDEAAFQTKHELLITDRIALKSAKTEIENRFPELWFELAKALVEPLNKAVKIGTDSKITEISPILQKVGLNSRISGKRLALILSPFYDFVAKQSRAMKTRHESCCQNASEAKTACPLLRSVMDAVRSAADRKIRGEGAEERLYAAVREAYGGLPTVPGSERDSNPGIDLEP